jgi:hypothetical protein
MPRINQAILDTTFYLYHSREDAQKGRAMGGTGFLVAYVTQHNWRPDPHIYAVTNWHVAVGGGASVVRINCYEGAPDIFEFGPDDWQFVPGADDIALVRIPLDRKKHQANAIDLHRFVTRESLRWSNVTTGDDVFMVGRFMDHDGGEINLPAVRFGNISVLPTPIYLPELGRKREYYCIDLHSRSGFSGSPVFAYRTIGHDLTGNDVRELVQKMRQGFDRAAWDFHPYLALLGIHCAQFDERLAIERVQEAAGKKVSKEYVIGLSGMTMVAPAWGILEALELPVLEQERAELDSARDPSKIHMPGARLEFDQARIPEEYLIDPNSSAGEPPTPESDK